MIYDWDSLRLTSEAEAVGAAAAHFTYTEYFDVPRVPAGDESRAFVSEYEEARRAPFTADERASIAAATTYGAAYSARCEHAVDVRGEHAAEGLRGALRATGTSFLDR